MSNPNDATAVPRSRDSQDFEDSYDSDGENPYMDRFFLENGFTNMCETDGESEKSDLEDTYGEIIQVQHARDIQDPRWSDNTSVSEKPNVYDRRVMYDDLPGQDITLPPIKEVLPRETDEISYLVGEDGGCFKKTEDGYDYVKEKEIAHSFKLTVSEPPAYYFDVKRPLLFINPQTFKKDPNNFSYPYFKGIKVIPDNNGMVTQYQINHALYYLVPNPYKPIYFHLEFIHAEDGEDIYHVIFHPPTHSD